MKRAALLVLSVLAGAAHAGDVPSSITAQQLRADVDHVLKLLAETHPDAGFSADLPAIAKLAKRIRTEAAPQQSRDEAWRQLARFNPLFADAHLSIAFPDWRADTAAHLTAGHGLFPLEVMFDPQGRLLVASALGGEASGLAGARIVSINGIAAGKAGAALLARAPGDTPAFRRHLLTQRWWYFHWKMYGAPQRYRLVLERGGKRWTETLPASGDQPAVLAAEGRIDDLFAFAIPPGCPAVLTVGSFEHTHVAHLKALTQDFFTRLRDAGAGTGALVIDVSANGGGDDTWLEALMPYLATQRYRTGSHWIKRVMEANPQRNEPLGQIVRGEIETWREPQPEHPLAFKGKVFVRIGPATYSSAVLFANVMRDFGFATLIGEGGAVRRMQSGGVRSWTLPHSKLVMYVPRFVLAPPVPTPEAALLDAQASAPPACAAAN